MMKLTTEMIWQDLEEWKREARKLHHEPYALYRDFYLGGDRPLRYIRKNSRESDEHWLERLGRLVGANYCAPIVNKPVQAEYGGAVRRTVGDPELQRRLDAIARANALHTFQLKTARQRAIDGAAVVQAYWAPASSPLPLGEGRVRALQAGAAPATELPHPAPASGHPSDGLPLPAMGAPLPRGQGDGAGGLRLKHILPEHFFPIVTDDYERIDAVILDRRASSPLPLGEGRVRDLGRGAPSAPRLPHPNPLPGGEGGRVEIYTPDDIAIYEDGVRINDPASLPPGERPAQYGVLPFVVFNGRRLVGDVLGTSMLRGIAELNHALNESINNVLEILRFQAFSLLVIQGGLHGLPTDAEGRPRLAIGEAGFLNIDAEGRVYFADPNPKIGEVLAVIDRLIAMMYETGSIPVAVVQPQQSHAESAASRQVQFMPLVDLVEELITHDLEAERALIEKALLIDAIHRSGPTSLDEVRERMGRVEIEFPRNFLPMDEAARFELARAKREAGLLTRRMMLRAERPELSDEELDSLIAELDEEKK